MKQNSLNTVFKRQDRRETENRLFTEISKIQTTYLDELSIDKKNTLKNQLKQYEKRHWQRYIHTEQGARPGLFRKKLKIFFRSTTKTETKKFILALTTDDNIELTYIDNIKTEVHTSYSKLYSRPLLNPDDIDPVLDFIDTKIADEGNTKLTRPITIKEIKEAVDHMKDNEFLGEDGLPREFYKKFGHIIFPDFAAIYNTLIFAQSKPKSFHNAIVSLLFKKNNRKLLKKTGDR